jgi:hypothetical protein
MFELNDEREIRRSSMIKVILLMIFVFIVFNGIKNFAIEYDHKDKFNNPQLQFEYIHGVVSGSESIWGIPKSTHLSGPTWAIYKLGQYYEHGYGTKVDLSKAYAFYKLGAQFESKDSIEALTLLKLDMTKDQIAQGENLFRLINIEQAMKNNQNYWASSK